MQKTLTLLLLLLLSNMALADSNGDSSTTPPKNPPVLIKDHMSSGGPRSLTDVVAVGVVNERVVEVIFVQQLGEVSLTLSNGSGELDYAVSNTDKGSVLMMLPAEASGEITITITDMAGNEYVGEFTLI